MSNAETANYNGRKWRKPPFIKNPYKRWSLIIISVVYVVAAFATMEVDWQRAYEGLERGANFILSFARPDFVTRFTEISEGIIESLVMALAATVVGVAISIPIALGAARNISFLPIYLICRMIIAISRALNEVIVAILMVAIFGFGPLAGFITLSFSTIGFIGKLLAEEIEKSNKVQAEAIRSTGSSWMQMINYGYQPQFMPRLIGLSMYRLDSNFRHSSVLGLVGAGGVGATLNTAFSRYEFDTAAAIILIIIVLVVLLEYLSSLIRAWVQ